MSIRKQYDSDLEALRVALVEMGQNAAEAVENALEALCTADTVAAQKIVQGDDRITGVHSNGYSLVRKTLGINEKSVRRYIDEFGKTLGEELLTPTKIYVKAIQSLMGKVEVKGISHITGGGFYENVPRMLPAGIVAKIEKAAMPVPPVFDLIAKTGKIPERDMYNTFNMGAGLVLAVAAEDASRAVAAISAAGEQAYVIGECVNGAEKGVELV